jgi:hypothetical protein
MGCREPITLWGLSYGENTLLVYFDRQPHGCINTPDHGVPKSNIQLITQNKHYNYEAEKTMKSTLFAEISLFGLAARAWRPEGHDWHPPLPEDSRS